MIFVQKLSCSVCYNIAIEKTKPQYNQKKGENEMKDQIFEAVAEVVSFIVEIIIFKIPTCIRCLMY